MSRNPRRPRILSATESDRLLESIGESRRLLTGAMASLPIRGPEYLAAEAVVAAIDGLAEALTGSREHFWSRAPTANEHLL